MNEPTPPTIRPSTGPNSKPATRIGNASKVNLKFATFTGVRILNTQYTAINIAELVNLFVFMTIIILDLDKNKKRSASDRCIAYFALLFGTRTMQVLAGR